MSSCTRRNGPREGRRRGKTPTINRADPNSLNWTSFSLGTVEVPKGEARNTEAARLRREGYTVVEGV